MRRFTILTLAAFLVLLAFTVTPALAAPGFDQSVDKLVAQGYPMLVDNSLAKLGSTALGFRFGGSPPDNEAARIVAAEMRAMGLVNVRLERVPLDVWDFKGASVEVGAKTLIASTFGGVPGTPVGGFTGDVVYVGTGSAAEFDAAGDVRGKLVLVDAAFTDLWWLNLPGAEAALRGARGVILTYSSVHPNYYSADPQALGSFDGTYDMSWAPLVFISQRDGDWLKGQLLHGPATATMTSIVDITRMAQGGAGYNVVGELRGSAHDGQMVLISAHKDAYFHAVMDDTSGVACMLTIAKAMRMSRYRPQHTVVFMATTGEEFGNTNSYYDWLIGSWYSITKRHPDWAGRIVGQINLEMQGMLQNPFKAFMNPEMRTFVDALTAANPSLVPYGTDYSNYPQSWNDQWPFTAAGVPSISTWTNNAAYHTGAYHTNYDNAELANWPYLGQNAKFEYRLARALDRGVLPYDMKLRADDLAGAVDGAGLKADGADAVTVDKLSNHIAAFQVEAAAFNARRGGIPASRVTTDNRKLLALEKLINSNFTALDVWDKTTYPHAQVQKDVEALNATLAELAKASPSKADALSALGGVGLTWYGINFSHAVYAKDLTRHAPGYRFINWGGQGHLAKYLDVMAQYLLIDSGSFATAATQLTAMRDAEVADLNKRLTTMDRVVREATSMLKAIM